MSAPAATAHLVLAVEPADRPDVMVLIEASDAYSLERYPPEGHFGSDVSGLMAPDVVFLVARLDGRAVGCGAVKWFGDKAGELKRVFVSDAARGHGVGRAMMQRLEAIAAARGVETLFLETGPLNTEAVAMYRRFGYRVCGPFGDYAANPYSLFMTKHMTAEPSNEG